MATPQPVSSRMYLLTSCWPGVALLLLSAITALCCYTDYGMSWDELAQHGLGMVTYDYVLNGNNALTTYGDRALGTGFELPLYFMDKWLHLQDTRDIYLARHLATHLFFLLSVFCGYVLAWRLFRDHFIACLAFILIAFHPRLYAHSFFNTKDIPFLSAFLIALLISHIAFETNKAAWYLLLGLACGYATSIRLIGIIFAPIISVFLLIDISRNLPSKAQISLGIRNAALYAVGFCGMLYAAWPILWSNPFFYLRESIHNLARIAWTGEVLFNGKSYHGDALPWNYTPVWCSISIPELWLLAGVAGSVWVIVAFVKQPMKYMANTPGRHYLLYVACVVGPIIAMTIFHGGNIDDWRHLYFIYPSFVMLALVAVSKLAQGRRKRIVQASCALQVLATGLFMVNAHPYQQVYFNHFVSHDREYLRTHYDLEYWGLAYKQGLEYILAHDPSAVIAIGATFDAPVRNNVMLLPETSRKRIRVVGDGDRADYFITNFRMHPDDFGYPDVYYEIRVLNSTILRVYKLH
jgi:Dolichyl-phosphate-mannose-protein mannosyltransferase